MAAGLVADDCRGAVTGTLLSGSIGGSVGSWLGARAYIRFGWPGVCALVALALARHLIHRRLSRYTTMLEKLTSTITADLGPTGRPG
jgi:hypothetical protein